MLLGKVEENVVARSQSTSEHVFSSKCIWEGADRASRVQLLGVVSYKTSPSDDFPNLYNRFSKYSRSHRNGDGMRTRLEDTICLQSVNTNLGVLSGAKDLSPVREAGRAGPYCAVRVLNGGQRGRLQPLRDVDLLEELARNLEVIDKGLAIGYSNNSSML